MAKPLKSIKFPDLLDRYLVVPPVKETASGSVASFPDGADNLPVKDLAVAIVPKQTSGTPSPSNILPISGFTKATIKRAGKNILPYPYSGTTSTAGGVTRTVNTDGTISLSGTATADSSFVYTANLINVLKPNVGDVLVFTDGLTYASSRYSRALWADNLNGIGAVNGSLSVTITQEHLTRGIYYGMRITSGANCNGLTVKPMVRVYGDDTYEPYTAETYEVSFGSAGTVYGGTLDVTTGKLTVTWGIVDMGTLDWETHSGTTTGGLTIYRYDGLDRANGRQVYSDIYYDNIAASVSGMTDYQVTGNAASVRVYVVDSRYSTPAALKAGVAGHQLCYELATPVEYDLTPAEVRTLLGANNIWADTGAVDVEYVADTKMYIDNKIAETQALILES